MDTVHDLNEAVLERFAERSPVALAGLLRADIDEILATTADQDPGRPVPWLGESRVPVAGILAHLMNELQIHGWDIARATGVPWAIPPRDAALFFSEFLLGVTRHGHGRLLEGGGRPRERAIAVEYRSHYTAPATMVLQNGRVTVESPDSTPPDVRIFFEPVALNMMLFGRISKARAALTRKIVISGPRPWLLPAYLRTMRLPS